jgi:hypothetical protein
MAFYAQYQQPFGSNPHQFNYAAYSWDDQPYLQPTSCDDPGFVGYPPQPYQYMNEHTFNSDHLLLHGAASPVKGDFFYDNQLPVLSSTSDSGASIQSSSNMGSPSAQPLQAHEWNNQFGLCDGGNPAAGYESTTNPGNAKVGCVGEFRSVSSSHNFSFSPPSESTSSGKPWAGSQLASSNSSTSNPYQMPHGFPRRGSAGALHNMDSAESANINMFRPAASSAASFQPRSPVLERVNGQRRSFALPSPKHMRVQTRLARSSSAGGDTERLYAPQSPIQSPFFCQSSGNFVPPLSISRPSPFFQFSFLYMSSRRRKVRPVLTAKLQTPH